MADFPSGVGVIEGRSGFQPQTVNPVATSLNGGAGLISNDGPQSFFTITELTGEKRGLALSGRCCPFRPFKLDGEQRADMTMYPGNSVGTFQNQGPKEGPIHVEGHWSDQYLNAGDGTTAEMISNGVFDNNPIQTIEDLVDFADDIRAQGQLVKVQWQHRIRIGVLTKFSQSWRTLSDCDWEMEFTISAREEQHSQSNSATAVKVNPSDDANKASTAWSAMAVALQGPSLAQLDVVSDPRVLSALGRLQQDLANTLDTMQTTMDSLQDTIDSYVNGATDTAHMAGACIGIYGNLLAAGASLLAQVASQAAITTVQLATVPFSTLQSVGQAAYALYQVPASALQVGGTGLASAASLLQLTVYQNRYSQAVKAFMRVAANNILTLSQQIDPSIRAIYTCRSGDTLRSISLAFYEDAGWWLTLKRYNQMDSSVVTTGQLLYIPNSPASIYPDN